MSNELSNDQLKKDITFFPALSVVMGTVIGAGVFFKAAAVYQSSGSVSLGMFAWLLGGLITICAGLTGAELAAAIPKTGGMMIYIDHTYGKFASYLLGWAQVIIYFPANIAALAIIFGTQFANLLGVSHTYIVPIAIISALSITLINFLGARASGIFQSVTLVAKLIPIALIVIFGLFFNPNPVEFSLVPIQAGENKEFFSALAAALLATMFAYDGWIHVGNIAGEMKNPKKDLPKAIFLGLGLIMAVYLLVNLAFVMTAPIVDIAGNKNASSDVAMLLFGPMGGKLVTIGILISVYGTINGYTMTGIRIPYAMALENKLPFSSWLTKLSKTKIPYNSAILILGISVIMMFSGEFDRLTDMLLLVIWIFYNMTFLAVIILRKREPELVRPYKVPLYPIIPLFALIGGVFIVVMTLINQPGLSAIGLGLTALGIPIYLYKKSKGEIPSQRD